MGFSSPATGASVADTITVRGTASDNVGVSRVELQVDSGPWTTATGTTSWSYSLDTTSLSVGSHILRARATDAAGNTGTATATVNVQGSSAAFYADPGPNKMYFGASIGFVAEKYGGGQFSYHETELAPYNGGVGPKFQAERKYVGETGADAPFWSYEYVQRLLANGGSGALRPSRGRSEECSRALLETRAHAAACSGGPTPAP